MNWYENALFEQDFILEHYSEDGSNFQDQIDDLMDLRQVWYNICKRCQVRFLVEIEILDNINLISKNKCTRLTNETGIIKDPEVNVCVSGLSDPQS